MYLLIPHSRSLLQSIKCLLEKTNFIFLAFNQKTSRLLKVHFLIEITIEECCLYVKLSQTPTKVVSQRGYYPHGSHQSSRRKSLLIINPLLLSIAFGNEPCLVPFNGTIYLILDFVYPFRTNCLLPMRKINKNPNLVLHK
ncbi:hypothetical protein O6H91_Y097400 [Diphasiastrum complanatum]|nr:hypothetical protein O6H91_Y097400 [Diphasiastrum complanatum]